MAVTLKRSVVIGAVLVCAGSAALYARQQAPGSIAGTVVPAKFIAINKGVTESIPVTLTSLDPKFPLVPVLVTAAPDVEVSERSIQRVGAVMEQALRARQMWEYSVVSAADPNLATRLNTAGRDGWEAVAVIASNQILMKRSTR